MSIQFDTPTDSLGSAVPKLQSCAFAATAGVGITIESDGRFAHFKL